MDLTLTAIGWHTERGRRASNEDAVLAGTLPDGRDLIAIADGMGGHNAGEVASQSALETMLSGLDAGLSLQDAVISANATLYAAAQSNPEWAGMGTTLVALLRTGGQYEIANVGDSRAYRVTESAVDQITADHTFVAEAVSNGRLSPDDAQRSRWRNALTRALGTEADVEVDVFGPFDATEPHAVLLCSDGLYGSVSGELLHESLVECGDPETAAMRLTLTAFRNGSRDNISAAVAIFGGGFGVERRVESAPAEAAPVTRPPAVAGPAMSPRRVAGNGAADGDRTRASWLDRLFKRLHNSPRSR